VKKLLLLIFSLLLSFNANGEWSLVSDDEIGDIYFIDIDTITKKDGYVYVWYLVNYAEPYEGSMSTTSYAQIDCDLTRAKYLSDNWYKEPFGEGYDFAIDDPSPQWHYLPPNSVGEMMIDIACYLTELSEQLSPEEYQEFIEEFQILAEAEQVQMQLESIAENLKDQLPEGFSLGEEIVEDPLYTLRSAYIDNIAARVRTFWRYQGANDDWTCSVYVQQDIDGTVQAVNLKYCNLDDSDKARSFKNSIERAVYKASPLPSAPDEAVFAREIQFEFYVN